MKMLCSIVMVGLVAVWMVSTLNLAIATGTSSDVMSGLTVAMGPEDLKGKKRILVDGLATQEDCDMLLDLAQVGAKAYYQGRHHYSDFEVVEGIQLDETAKLVQKGVITVESADRFLTLTEKARQFVHRYFGLGPELYVQFTHLVCRTAEPYSSDQRIDLSHTVHSDNCKLNYNDWTCEPYEPHLGPLHARHYSSVIFLNDGFKGGKFFFSNRNLTAEATVQPKCGRVVAFSSGPENPHGVQAVVEGRRCVIAVWFTLDKTHDELRRHEARKVVDSLWKSGGHQSKAEL
ncbi:prolyl 3-hydroxylase 1-like [Branchiostoma floridae x Branchiostoma japonicum]